METLPVNNVQHHIDAWVNDQKEMVDINYDINDLCWLVWTVTDLKMEWFAGKHFKNIRNKFETLAEYVEEGSCKQYLCYHGYSLLN